MPNAYDNQDAAAAFTDFVNSDNGRIQRQLLYNHVCLFIPNKDSHILDAACGQGWLAAALHQQYPNIAAFDSSRDLVTRAKQQYPGINFQAADITGTLPYPSESFDVTVLNMAAHDINDLAKAFTNLCSVTKSGGTFIITIANPYYAYPVGVWKRGLWGRLLNKKPQLKLRPYHWFTKKTGQLHNWKGRLSSYFYPTAEYINQAINAGFELKQYHDLGLDNDSGNFDSQYQLYRYPLILLMVFKKRTE
jgi:SAM-dependent methyltransferase